jgi:hypothetical protein
MGQDFNADGAAQMGPQANLLLTLLQGVLEFVVNALHGVEGSELAR